MTIQVWTVKVLVLSALFLMTFTFSLIPVKFVMVAEQNHNPSSRRRYKRAISFLSCFAAGVFLGTCLLDLFPEVRNQISKAFILMQVNTSFPVGEFIMVFGLFMILITEQVVLSVKEKHTSSQETRYSDKISSETNPLLGRQRSDSGLSQGISNRPSASCNNSDDDELGRSLLQQQSVDSSFSSRGHSHDHSPDFEAHSPIRAFMLLLALSLHSIFEGLAVGLQPNTDDVLQIFAALVLHKCILAFSLGLNLVQSKLRVKVIVLSNLLFAVTSPMGIAIGILVIDLSGSAVSTLINGILQGIACGTFLYVTFFEVLPHEFNSNKNRQLKLLFLLLGFSAVCALIFLNPGDDSILCSKESVKNVATTTPHMM